MKQFYTFLNLAALMLIIPSLSNAQTTLYFNDFEGTDFDTYQLYNASGSSVNFMTVAADYITRAIPSSLPLGNATSGFSGNVIALEDYDGAGFSAEDHYIQTNPIDITGASGLAFEFRLAAPRGNDGNRYETNDILQVQISIDGGAYQTIISCGGGTDTRFYYDSGSDGINIDGNDILVDQNSQIISSSISSTGNSMSVRILFNSLGSQEEMLFDDIKVSATNVLGLNDLNYDTKIKVFPNPSKEFIQISNLDSKEPYTIFGVLGNEIKKGIISENEQIDISNFTNGMYFLKFENGNTIKFIKE
ncbi:T9SS type A sorting domain-containing protein [Winogradskyella marincola]|uniref:T9SS type A sorting domain-containing protein n=1 Tax=Winogradskyella marincola TaxID=3037795 RepID=A0ABT6FZY7_9FLAO|nr:T9SS type A sorting domain-containing protein [Winogradskyella sp. YYF002]MDG4715346.1 T9SS type A sorting domain-containing protein [Winogradskyella sp. YYF002]